MRMIDVNIFNSVKIAKTAIKHKSQKYFCVSTDKAANPVNMMGATKRIMEIYLRNISDEQKISMARFANVAFSDGSLLHGFNQRFIKKQPLTAPTDVKRYFVSQQESGQLCLLSALLGENRDIYFPKLSEQENMAKFSDIAIKYLKSLDYEPVLCHSEEEARRRSVDLIPNRKWPVYFFSSDTTGEKGYEEFFMKNEKVDLSKYAGLGVVKSNVDFNKNDLDDFSSRIHYMKKKLSWDKEELLELFHNLIPDFVHIEKGRYLDDKM
jgi:FlaA1/EpsC-like NDP-sugar epimerase